MVQIGQLCAFCGTRQALRGIFGDFLCVVLARCAALKERCPPRRKSKVERFKAKVEPLSTSVTVETQHVNARLVASEAAPDAPTRPSARLSSLQLSECTCCDYLRIQATLRFTPMCSMGRCFAPSTRPAPPCTHRQTQTSQTLRFGGRFSLFISLLGRLFPKVLLHNRSDCRNLHTTSVEPNGP